MRTVFSSSMTAVLATLGFLQVASAGDTLSLAGRWRFQLDRQDKGLEARWFLQRLPDTIVLPGSLPGQGIGDLVSTETKWTGSIVDKSWFTAPEDAKYRQPGHVKVPFWLQPEMYYAGAAWFQRDVEIPRDWAGKRVVLSLERPHWETRVWVDDRLVGTNLSLSTPHEYELGQLPLGKHVLTIRVDNRLIVDVGENSHSVSDHTQGNWNGIVGNISLRATPLVWIEELQVFPHPAANSVAVKVRLGNATGRSGSGQLEANLKSEIRNPKSERNPKAEARKGIVWNESGGECECELNLGEEARPWSEFTPDLYDVRVALITEDGRRSTQHVRFGFREISTEGTQFLVNGRKTFFRGTLECAIFPKTGHPPTDVESWERIIRVATAHGLNMFRFHSWCPPEAAFAAADQLGFYYHVEIASWANQSTTLGEGKPVDAWLYDEAARILKAYGNHPSFVLMPYGNEPGGPNSRVWLAKWVDHWKAADPRRLYTSGAGWPEIPENQFHVSPGPRIQAWGQGLRSSINGRPPDTLSDYRDYICRRNVPVISHEIGQWCVYPNFNEIRKYTGYLKPRNFEIFRDRLSEHHMADLAQKFLIASGKLQTLCYKEDIEAALRTPGMGGFQLLDLHDFPGQGTALVGVLDPFWEEKGYVTPAEYSRFCSSTVPLARLPKRVFTSDEPLTAEIEVAHFGPGPLIDAKTTWKLVAGNGKVAAQGQFPAQTLPVNNGIPLGSLNVSLKQFPAPSCYKLIVTVSGALEATSALESPTERRFENDWDIWIYAPSVSIDVPPAVIITHELDTQTLATLNSGGRVLLLIPPARVAPDKKLGRVALGFSPIFWNTAWTGRQPPHTLGVLCDPKHPLFADFPTESHSNWQWWYLVTRAGAMLLDELSPKLRPTVQVIDDWVTARRLGLVVEGKLGEGKLLVCSVDLENELEADPVRRQFRYSLLRYMASDRFAPRIAITAEQVRGLIAAPTTLQRVGVRAFRASSEEPGYEAGRAVDGDARTFWHTSFTGPQASFPHEFVLRLDHPVDLTGFTALPRQDGNRNGWIKDYAFCVSMNDRDWGEPVARGSFTEDVSVKIVKFDKPVTARYVRLVAISAFDKQPFASLAEFDVIEAEH